MKLLSYVLISLLALMCSSPKSDENAYLDEPNVEYEINEATLNSKVSGIAIEQEDFEQKIIKESFLRFETQDLEKTYNQIKTFVIQNKGTIQDDRSNKSYNYITRSLTVRIPTTRFQQTIDSISKHVSYFDTKQISAKDVTEEFVDLEARLKAKQTLEKRYLELLSKANNVKEILEIERELSNIREEIEAKQGRLKYLENRVSLSTINIEFYKLTSEKPITTSYGTKMWNAIKSGFNGISLFFLGILHIWPFILLLVAIGLYIRYRIKKSKK